MRAAPYTVLACYEGCASLEVDDINLDDGTARSVIARGELDRVLGEHELPDPTPMLSLDRQQWLRLDVSSITGRRFVVEPSPDGFSVEWQLDRA